MKIVFEATPHIRHIFPVELWVLWLCQYSLDKSCMWCTIEALSILWKSCQKLDLQTCP